MSLRLICWVISWVVLPWYDAVWCYVVVWLGWCGIRMQAEAEADVSCFIISLFNAQHVSDVNTSILRSLRLICWVISCVVLLWFDVCWCYGVVWLGWCGVVSGCRLKLASACIMIPHHTSRTTPTHIEPEQYKTWNKSTISRKLLKMDVLTFEICWAVNSEIIKRVSSSWSVLFNYQDDARSDKLKNIIYLQWKIHLTFLDLVLKDDFFFRILRGNLLCCLYSLTNQPVAVPVHNVTFIIALRI